MKDFAAFFFLAFGVLLLALFVREVASKRKARKAEPVGGRVLSFRKAERDSSRSQGITEDFEVTLVFELPGNARRSCTKSFVSKKDAEQWLEQFPVGSVHRVKADPSSSTTVYLAGEDATINPTALIVGLMFLGASVMLALSGRD